MKLTFWGVRGSYPKTGRSTLEYGGNTTCLEILSRSNEIYVVDAGTGIIELGTSLMSRYQGKVPAKLFISHDHWDHIQGFPFFVPAWVPGCTIEVYSGDKQLQKKLTEQNKQTDTAFLRKASLESMMHGNTSVLNKAAVSNHTKDVFMGQQDVERGYFPVGIEAMGSSLTFKDLKQYEIVANGVWVSYMYHIAHPGGMFSYQLGEFGKRIVFTGDYEHDGARNGEFGPNDQKMIGWARHADVFVIDAQYTPEEYGTPADHKQKRGKKGWGHSQIERVCELAAAAEVRKLYVTHHDPTHDDVKLNEMELRSQQYMRYVVQSNIPVTFAKEGMSIEI